MTAAYEFLDRQAARHGLRTAPAGRGPRPVRRRPTRRAASRCGARWCSAAAGDPEFKVYFNPEAPGGHRAPGLVAEALRPARPGRVLPADARPRRPPRRAGPPRPAGFFALDLHDGPQARVKLYVTHHDAEVAGRRPRRRRGRRASTPTEVAEFCALAGAASDRFAGRPLVGSYTLTEGRRPAGRLQPLRADPQLRRRRRARPATGWSALLDRYGFDRAAARPGARRGDPPSARATASG